MKARVLAWLTFDVLTASSMQLLSMPTIQELVGKISELQGFRQAEEWRKWRLEALAALGDQSDFMREVFFLGRGYIILKTPLSVLTTSYF